MEEEQIEHLIHQPPDDTRAWARAMLLRLAGPDRVDAVDWDSITCRIRGPHGCRAYRRVGLTDPLAFTRADTERHFRSGGSLAEILNALGAEPVSDRRPASDVAVVWPIVPAYGVAGWGGGNGR